MKRNSWFILFVGIIAGLTVGACVNPLDSPLLDESVEFAAKSMNLTSTYDLIAGRNIYTGVVEIKNDDKTLFITYKMNSSRGWVLARTYLAIAPSLDEVPNSKRGYPIPWKFKSKDIWSPPIAEYTYEISLIDNGLALGTELSIAAHAIVRNQDATKNRQRIRSVWAIDEQFPGKKRAKYIKYKLESDVDPAVPRVTLPPGYDSQDLVIAESTLVVPERIDHNFVPIDKIFDISLTSGPANFGEEFAEIRFKYNRHELVGKGIKEIFQVFFFDTEDSTWKEVDKVEVDLAKQEIIAYTSHLTPFMPAGVSAEADIVFVDVNNGDDLNPGTETQPLKTIQAGVDLAYSFDTEFIPAVFVAEGTYDVSCQAGTHIVMKGEISIYGGYSPDWAVRNTVSYPTIIQDQSATGGFWDNPNRAIEAPAGVTIATVIDGFTINGGGGNYSCAIYNSGGSPTIQNNVIDGGSASEDSYGIFCYVECLPTIQNNTINGGSGSGSSRGIFNSHASAVIQNNTINGGSGNDSYGIFNSDNSPPIIQNNAISGGSGDDTYGIFVDYNSSPTIQNNTINGGSASDDSHGISCDTECSPLIQDNTINGGGGNWNSYGISCDDSSSPTIQNNFINGGNGYWRSHGIYTSPNSTPTVQNNTINGGSGAIYCHGVYNNSSSLTIRNNLINGGDAINFSHGIYNNMSSPTIQNNSINGGSGSEESQGIYNHHSPSPTIQNNTIDGGSGDSSHGIYNETASPTIQNNTVDGGKGSKHSSGIFNIIYETGYSSPIVENNIVFTSGGTSMYGIFEYDTDSDPISIFNNDIFDCPTAMYYDADGNGDLSTIAEMEADLLAEGINTGENISVDPVFMDKAGGDWHLTESSPLSVTRGGLDLSTWFTNDKENVTRTVFWSMGAYEYEGGIFTGSTQTKLLASDGFADGYFGYSVSIYEDTVVAGAYGDIENGPWSGAVYVFRRNGGTWTQEAKLTASDGITSDYFGWSVSVSGDTAVVGAPGDTHYVIKSGSAYVFRRNGGSWTQEAKLTPSDGGANFINFGRSVSIDGDTAVIGAYRDGDNGIFSGSAYVFRRTGGVWNEEAKLTPSDGDAYDLFGSSVSISGDTAIVGTPGDDDACPLDPYCDSGSAYVFTRNSGTWNQEGKLTAGDGATGERFGNSVSIDVDISVIGANWDDDNGIKSGSAYIFRRSGNAWTEEVKIIPHDGASNDYFGSSVSVSRDTVIVGAPWDDDNAYQSGSIYVFLWNGSTWTMLAKLTASDGAGGDLFGSSVSLYEDIAAVGAYHDDDNGNSTGSAYVLEW